MAPTANVDQVVRGAEADYGAAAVRSRPIFRRATALLACALATALGCVTLNEQRVQRCDGMRFAASCGDGRCASNSGEDADTCPADCVDAKVVSYNLQTICDAVEQVYEPTSAAEVRAIVRRARASGTPVRVVGRRHSSNAQLCSEGVVISTARLDHALYIERFEGEETVVTEPGIRYGDLTEWLHQRGRSLGFAVLGTRDPSIAGAIATASHGSSPRHSSVISTLVRSLEVVDADGELREYTRSTTDPATWKTLTASLGLAGIVTKLRLRVEPTFNLDVQVTYHPDASLGDGDGPIELVRECDYGQLVWFPGRGRVVKMCGIKSELPAQVGATNRLLKPDFKEWVAGPAERALHYGTCNERFNCATLERVRYRQFVREPPFYRKPAADEGDRSFHNVVGVGNRMMSSELTLAQQGILEHDFEFALPASRAAAAFAAAREHFKDERVCLPLIGVFIRFSRVEDAAWLAHTGAAPPLFNEGDFVTFFEMPIYMPEGITAAARDEYMLKYRALIERLILEFGARPHWGKNDDWVFDIQRPARAYGPRWEQFRRAVHRLDPNGVFANDWVIQRGLRDAR